MKKTRTRTRVVFELHGETHAFFTRMNEQTTCNLIEAGQPIIAFSEDDGYNAVVINTSLLPIIHLFEEEYEDDGEW